MVFHLSELLSHWMFFFRLNWDQRVETAEKRVVTLRYVMQIQTIGFLSYLRMQETYGPFMVLGPLSTLTNWVNEFERFCPDIKAVMYHGAKKDRLAMLKKDFKNGGLFYCLYQWSLLLHTGTSLSVTGLITMWQQFHYLECMFFPIAFIAVRVPIVVIDCPNGPGVTENVHKNTKNQFSMLWHCAGIVHIIWMKCKHVQQWGSKVWTWYQTSKLYCFADGRHAGKDFPVMVTSYEIVMADIKLLQKFNWKFIIVDEGHRLKNFDCKLMRELKTLNCQNRLILSGN